jgi:hypothetical protein
MREAVSPALVAQRLGHADGGALLLRTYSTPGLDDQRVALRALENGRSRTAAGGITAG